MHVNCLVNETEAVVSEETTELLHSGWNTAHNLWPNAFAARYSYFFMTKNWCKWLAKGWFSASFSSFSALTTLAEQSFTRIIVLYTVSFYSVYDVNKLLDNGSFSIFFHNTFQWTYFKFILYDFTDLNTAVYYVSSPVLISNNHLLTRRCIRFYTNYVYNYFTESPRFLSMRKRSHIKVIIIISIFVGVTNLFTLHKTI